MKVYAFGIFVVLAALTALAAQSVAQPVKDSDEELAKKIQRLKDQLEPLIRAQKERASELAEKQRIEAERKATDEAVRRVREEEERKQAEKERKAKEAAEKKKHVAKVEIRGTLGAGAEQVNWGGVGQVAMPAWYVTINDLKWKLDFGNNKELAAEAAKLAGKPVVITGVVVNVKKVEFFNPYQAIPRELLPPRPWGPYVPPQPPIYPQPGPYPWPQAPMQVMPVATPITINVETLKAAKD